MLEDRDVHKDISELIMPTTHDPLAYAEINWDWGHGFLENRRLETWQEDVLGAIGQDLKAGRQLIRVSPRSGHGVGKTTLLSMIAKWGIETCPGAKGRITANTEKQLRTVVMPTMRQWNGMSLTREWVELSATRLQASTLMTKDENLRQSWRLDLVPFSDVNPIAFQGLHNTGLRLIIVVEEGSGMPDSCFETIQGALAASSDTEVILFVPGNCNYNYGFFKEIHTSRSRGWHLWKVDTRDTTLANQTLIEEWKETYGEDSDFFRVRVRGEFPRASSTQFFSGEEILEARRRKVEVAKDDPIVIAVDVGRQGDDPSVIAERHGWDCRSAPWHVLQEADTMQLVGRVAARAHWLHDHMKRWPDAIFVDATGVGGPVADRLRQLLPEVMVVDVDFGAKSTGPVEGHRAKNMRAEIHIRAREALRYAAIPDDDMLAQEMEAIEYGYAGDQASLQIVRKDDIRDTLGRSPDRCDAYCLLWAMPIHRIAPRSQNDVEPQGYHSADWMPGGVEW